MQLEFETVLCREHLPRKLQTRSLLIVASCRQASTKRRLQVKAVGNPNAWTSTEQVKLDGLVRFLRILFLCYRAALTFDILDFAEVELHTEFEAGSLCKSFMPRKLQTLTLLVKVSWKLASMKKTFCELHLMQFEAVRLGKAAFKAVALRYEYCGLTV